MKISSGGLTDVIKGPVNWYGKSDEHNKIEQVFRCFLNRFFYFSIHLPLPPFPNALLSFCGYGKQISIPS